MNLFIKNIFRFVIFILLQAFVLDKVPPLHQFIKPSLYFLFILWLPFNMSKVSLMLVAFIFGLTMDFFTGTPGLHAAPCVLIAYLRPFVLNVLVMQEKSETNFIEPSFSSMGIAPYAVYIFLLTFIHHSFLVFLEWMQFGNFLFFIGKVTGMTLVSILLVFITEMLLERKGKYRAV